MQWQARGHRGKVAREAEGEVASSRLQRGKKGLGMKQLFCLYYGKSLPPQHPAPTCSEPSMEGKRITARTLFHPTSRGRGAPARYMWKGAPCVEQEVSSQSAIM